MELAQISQIFSVERAPFKADQISSHECIQIWASITFYFQKKVKKSLNIPLEKVSVGLILSEELKLLLLFSS